MKKIYFFAVCILIAFSSRSQNFAWGEASAAACGSCGLATSVSGAIAVDALGNVYTTGSFNTNSFGAVVDFDPGPGTFTMVSFPMAVNDVYVTKVNSAGNFVWAKKLSSTGADNGYGIAVDASGNVYVTGTFQNTLNCDPNITNYTLATVGSNDIFIVKFNSSGTFVWGKQFGSTSNDLANQITIDAGGNVLTVGNFQNTVDFDPGPSVNNVTSFGSNDGFVSKLDANGNFIWVRQIGGTGGESIATINIDQAGNILTAGGFGSFAPCDFDPGPGTFTMTGFSGSDVFVHKMDPSGIFVWAKQLGGPNVEIVGGVVTDPTGNVYTTGFFNVSGDYDPGPGTFNLVSAGGYDAFLSKLDGSGNFVWAKRLGGPADDAGGSLGLDPSGNVYSTGTFSATADFDPGASTFNMTSNGRDIYISKLDLSGNFVWAGPLTTFTSVQKNVADLTTDASGNIYINCDSPPGSFDCDPGPGTFYISVPNGGDAFVIKLSTPCSPPSSPGTISGSITVCSSSSQTYSIAPVSGATSYNWSFPAGWTGTSTTNIINVTAGSSGNVSVTASNSCSTTAAQILSVTITPIPGVPVSIIGNVSVCASSVNIYSIAPVANATSYNWTLPGGWTGISTTNSINATAGLSGGTITVSASNACGTSATQIKTVTITPIPSMPGTISGSTLICSSSSHIYSIALVAGATSYNWSLPAGWTGSSTSNTINATANASSSNITVSASNACGSSAVQTLSVTINPPPAQPVSINGNTSICPNSTNIYSIALVSGASSYNWTLPGGWTGASTTNTINTTASATSGNVLVSASNSCGVSPAQTISVTVNPGPTTTGPISGTISLCNTASVTLYSVSPVVGAISYNWTLPAGWSGASTSNVINATPGSSGIFSVTVTNSCGTGAAQTLSVTIYSPLSTPASISGNISVCQGSSNTYSVVLDANATSYIWTLPGGWSGASVTNVINTTAGSSSGNISISTSNACGVSSAQNLSVAVSAAPSITVTSTNNSICSGSSLTLTASGANTYTWNTGPINPNISVTPTTNTTYTVIGTSTTGCNNTATKSITVNPLPTINSTTSNSILCVGQSASLTANGASTYTWNPGGAATSIVVSPTVTTSYTITGTDAIGCSGTTVFTQNVTLCTGVLSIQGEKTYMMIYPNPFNDKITVITNEKSPIKILNALGMIVYSGEVKEKTEIDLSEQANGIYFVKIGGITKKIIKE